MLHSFTCKNFYSFSDLAKVDFVVNKKVPEDNGYLSAPSGVRLSKIEAIIGANASGKTNLLKVLPFLKWLILDSFVSHPNAKLPVKTYLFDDNKKPVELSVTFEIDKNIYTYRVILDASRILFEQLIVKNKSNKKSTSKTLFSRKWLETKSQYEFNGKNFKLSKDFGHSLRFNASVISLGIGFNHPQSQEIASFWQRVETNVEELGWEQDHLAPNAVMKLPNALLFYSNNAKLKRQVEKLLSRFDLGLDAIEIDAIKQTSTEFSIDVRVIHQINGEKKYLPIQYESSGSKQLVIQLKNILMTLDKGGVAVLDEFDASLHPDILLMLLDLFLHPETNPNNAQLVFTTHNHLVLSKLDKYQIVLTEKNDEGKSETWRLDEMKNVRADENYYAKYLAGAYGAIPRI